MAVSIQSQFNIYLLLKPPNNCGSADLMQSIIISLSMAMGSNLATVMIASATVA